MTRVWGWKLGYVLSAILVMIQAVLGTTEVKIEGKGAGRAASQAMAAQAGPHGTLLTPGGGKLIRSVGGMGTLTVKFAKWVGNEGQTIAIDVHLRPIDDDENRTDYLLGNGLTSGRNNTTIEVHFSSRWACGSYNLVITEHQFHKGVHISFQVAAPKIKITCLPIE